jgi:bis(5'-nucleosyl)-tetraphosphatase (symmetrical)
MALYIVGDVQGCFSALQGLLAQVAFDPKKDQLYLAGDIVARGTESLAVLRFVKALGDSATMVLGNHDLHLLAIHAGLKKAKKADKLDEVLNAPDREDLLQWLKKQPLLVALPDTEAFMSHAGLSPQWTLAQAKMLALFAQEKLASDKSTYWLAQMYGEKPNNWLDVKSEQEKFRFTINAFTRIRYCFADKSLEFKHKLHPAETPKNLIPWYELTEVIQETPWVIGHWASLMGNCSTPNIYALDTGCVWGNHLTLLRWHDKKRFQQPCLCNH